MLVWVCAKFVSVYNERQLRMIYKALFNHWLKNMKNTNLRNERQLNKNWYLYADK